MELKEGYKQTEVGVIPSDWDVKKLGKVSPLQRGFDLPYRNRRAGTVPIVTSSGVCDMHDQHQVLAPGVVTGRYGTIGEVYFIEENFWPLNTTLFVKDFRGNNPLFISYLLCTIDFKSHSGKSGVPGVNRNDLHELIVALPPFSEQTAIATALSDADALIQFMEKLIAKKRLIKQGAMQELLKPKEDWMVKRLGTFLDYVQPTRYLVKDTEYNDNDTPVLTAGKTFILGYTNEEFGIYKDNLPVIIFDDFTTATKYVDFPFKAKSSAMKILRKKYETVNLKFIFEIMQQINYPLGDHKRHWIAEYQNIKIRIPKPEEETRIANILSDMDAEISALETKLAKYKMIKQGMMQNLLTGKIRLV